MSELITDKQNQNYLVDEVVTDVDEPTEAPDVVEDTATPGASSSSPALMAPAVEPAAADIVASAAIPKTGSYKVIYIYRIDDGEHDGRLKIGDATYHTDKPLSELLISYNDSTHLGLYSNDEIADAARARIDQQTKTAAVEYKLLFSALAIKPASIPGRYDSFRDHDVHRVLLRSGFEKRTIRADKRNTEWFEVSLTNAVNAVLAVVNNKPVIDDVDGIATPVLFRDEQQAAIKAAKRVLTRGTQDKPASFLWNAIMRFGKTISTFGLIDEMFPQARETTSKSLERQSTGQDATEGSTEATGASETPTAASAPKVLILTHRPVVSSGWNEDFTKFFGTDSGWQFGAKHKDHGLSWEELDKSAPFIYFASIQDLRGSFKPQGNLDTGEIVDEADLETIFHKNEALFDTRFDLIVVDESHEGTQTELAQRMNGHLTSPAWLHLSGTPFNIVHKFSGSNAMFNWTYADERDAFDAWEERKSKFESGDSADNPGDVNPYGTLPTMEIRTYDIANVLRDNSRALSRMSEGVSFSFAKFFATETKKDHFVPGKVYDSYAPFKNPKYVSDLLNKMFAKDEYESEEDRKLFPFSRNDSAVDFAHTFWLLPSVAACKALHEMLVAQHSEFFVVNATADNDGGDALKAVRRAIKENERTITLSISKLTTGTTIPEWTGVFMLSNTNSPSQYLQTIFRVKSPGSLVDGRAKTTGVVFDFDPDRCLKMILEAAHLQSGNKDTGDIDENREQERTDVNKFLSYLPVVAYDGAKFVQTNADKLMRRLQRVFVEETVSSGFISNNLFNINLRDISEEDKSLMSNLEKMMNHKSKKPKSPQSVEVPITTSGLADGRSDDDGRTPEPTDEDDQDVPSEEMSEEERKQQEEQQADNMRNVLKAFSARIPILLFASRVPGPFSLHRFPEMFDDETWDAFAPKGMTKENWPNYVKFFHQDIFEGSCEMLFDRAAKIDEAPTMERVASIAHLLSTFKGFNSDAVISPWRAVNRQCAKTLGGLRWVDDFGAWYCDDGEARSWEEIQDAAGEFDLDPIWVDGPEIVSSIFDAEDSTFFDIDAKSGLHLVYVVASILHRKMEEHKKMNDGREMDETEQRAQWADIIENRISLNARLPYSLAIAKRVLAGNDEIALNNSVVDVMALKDRLAASYVANRSGKMELTTEEDQAGFLRWVFTRNDDFGHYSVEDKANMIFNNSKRAAALKALTEDEEANKKAYTAVVSNPQYKVDGSTSYHRFTEVAQTLAENVSMMSPANWLLGGMGRGLNVFRARELESMNYVTFTTIPLSKNILDTVVPGGVSFFLWNASHEDATDYNFDGKSEKRYTLLDGMTKMVHREDHAAVVKLIDTRKPIIVGQRDFYGPQFMSIDNIKKAGKGLTEGLIVLYATQGRGIKQAFVPNGTVFKDTSGYKLLASKTGSADTKGSLRRWDRMFIVNKDYIPSSSFIQVARFEDEEIAQRALFYLKTDFATFLHGVTTSNHNASAKTYLLIPNVDFATGRIEDRPEVPLDFSDHRTLDDQLAQIYKLTEADRALMASSIRPWKDKYSLTADDWTF